MRAVVYRIHWINLFYLIRARIKWWMLPKSEKNRIRAMARLLQAVTSGMPPEVLCTGGSWQIASPESPATVMNALENYIAVVRKDQPTTPQGRKAIAPPFPEP